MTAASLLSIQVGRIAPLGPDAVPSGFVKTRIDGPVQVGPLGPAGDEQADPSVHGGPDKAVYGYSAAHLAAWARDFPEHASTFVAGGVGENLTINGLTEDDLCVGDVHRIGSASLQVVQPRQPCFKFALRFDDSRLPKAMVRNFRTGWYYRVVEPGVIRAGDKVERVDRPHPEFRFSRLVEIVNFRNANADELEAMATMDGIALGLRRKAQAVLGRAP